MLERWREHEEGRIAFLTLLSDEYEGVRVLHETRHPQLRRPRITICCRPGTSFKEIKLAFIEAGWNLETYRQWVVNNGQYFLERGEVESDSSLCQERSKGR
jgi:hypothetical protein